MSPSSLFCVVISPLYALLPRCLSFFVPALTSLFVSPVASEEDELWTAVVLPACRELWRAAVLLAFIDNITLADVEIYLWQRQTLPAPLRPRYTKAGIRLCLCVCVCVCVNGFKVYLWEQVRGVRRKIHCLSAFVCVSYSLPDPSQGRSPTSGYMQFAGNSEPRSDMMYGSGP